MTRLWLSVFGFLLFFGTALAGDIAPQSTDDGWETARPSEAGLDPKKLDELTADIRNGRIINVHAVLIEHDGKLVYEGYFSGTDQNWGTLLGIVGMSRETLHDLRSVTKSVTSAILGIALEGEHRKAVERPITDFFPDKKNHFGDGLEKVTLQNVLTMTAGLEWNEMTVPYTSNQNDEIRMYYAADPVDMVLSRSVKTEPGSKWYYNGGLTQVLAGIIQNKTGKPLNKYAEEALFEPLGITEYEWHGSPAWRSEKSPNAASALRLRARDLAKIGSLYLNGGVWRGKQIIPRNWIELSSQAHVARIPWGGHTGTYGYGYQWYPGVLHGPGKLKVVRAAGNGEQRIFVIPQLKLTVTMFAGNYNNFTIGSDGKVMRKILEALSEAE